MCTGCGATWGHTCCSWGMWMPSSSARAWASTRRRSGGARWQACRYPLSVTTMSLEHMPARPLARCRTCQWLLLVRSSMCGAALWHRAGRGEEPGRGGQGGGHPLRAIGRAGASDALLRAPSDARTDGSCQCGIAGFALLLTIRLGFQQDLLC